MRFSFQLVFFCFVLTTAFMIDTVVAQQKTCRQILDELAARHEGDFDAVVKRFKGLALEGDNPARAFYVLGIAHDIKGLKKEARNFYKRSIQLQPDNNPASKFLDYLDGNEDACSVADEKSSAMVDASAVRGVTPEEMVDSYSRYKGQVVVLDGWIIDKPYKRRGRSEIVCSILLSDSGVRRNMDGFFLIRSSAPFPNDRRIARGGKISVRGIVSDRDFIKNSVTREMSTDRKIIIEPFGIRVTNEGVQAGPLTVRLK